MTSTNAVESPTDQPFWRTRTLAQMTPEEWESLCDGCGRCCLNKLEYEDTGLIEWTDVACRMLDQNTCRCRDYPHRHALVPDCLALSAQNVPRLTWLPHTCAYRLVAERRGLYWWHPLISGDPETVHLAGISVRGRTVSEEVVPVDDFEKHVVRWPSDVPKRALAR